MRQLCLVNFGANAVFELHEKSTPSLGSVPTAAGIEGIGRAQVEPSFLLDVADKVVEVDDAASCAGAWLLEEISGRRFGGSSGINLVASLMPTAHAGVRQARQHRDISVRSRRTLRRHGV